MLLCEIRANRAAPRRLRRSQPQGRGSTWQEAGIWIRPFGARGHRSRRIGCAQARGGIPL